jgi:hypothetical protein
MGEGTSGGEAPLFLLFTLSKRLGAAPELALIPLQNMPALPSLAFKWPLLACL